MYRHHDPHHRQNLSWCWSYITPL